MRLSTEERIVSTNRLKNLPRITEMRPQTSVNYKTTSIQHITKTKMPSLNPKPNLTWRATSQTSTAGMMLKRSQRSHSEKFFTTNKATKIPVSMNMKKSSRTSSQTQPT